MILRATWRNDVQLRWSRRFGVGTKSEACFAPRRFVVKRVRRTSFSLHPGASALAASEHLRRRLFGKAGELHPSWELIRSTCTTCTRHKLRILLVLIGKLGGRPGTEIQQVCRVAALRVSVACQIRTRRSLRSSPLLKEMITMKKIWCMLSLCFVSCAMIGCGEGETADTTSSDDAAATDTEEAGGEEATEEEGGE